MLDFPLKQTELVVETCDCLVYFCLETLKLDISCKMLSEKKCKRDSGLKENYGQRKVWIEMSFISEDLGFLPLYLFTN